MIAAAATFLTFAVLGGLTAASMHMAKFHVPLWVGLVHGAFALPGVGILAVDVTIRRGWAELPSIALVIFLLAAAGGLYMFIRHGKRRQIPKLLIVGHGAAALTGYVILLVHVFT